MGTPLEGGSPQLEGGNPQLEVGSPRRREGSQVGRDTLIPGGTLLVLPVADSRLVEDIQAVPRAGIPADLGGILVVLVGNSSIKK